MEAKFSKQETIKLIEEYYERLEGKKVKVTIVAEEGIFGLYETKGYQTTITVKETMNIAGMKKDVKYTLSIDELEEKMIALFALYAFEVKSIKLNDGVSSYSTGYGMMEHTVQKTYFNGVIMDLEKCKNVSLKKTV